MAGGGEEPVLQWRGPLRNPERWEGTLRCPHGEVAGAYFVVGFPATRAQAARGMIVQHQYWYRCACTRGWLDHY